MTGIEGVDIGSLYRKLAAVGGKLADTVDGGEAAQETLDVVALAAGLKPVVLLGRGLDDPQWVGGAADIAVQFGAKVTEGPFWDATPYGRFPDWYRDHTVAQLRPYRATYICADEKTEDRVRAINDAEGRLAMTEEARLLGYPDCCVVAHYDRAVQYHRAALSILKRLARGDEARMQALLHGGAALAPATPDEIARMETAFDLYPAPFGSWNRCPHCVRDDDSPSARLSQKYRALAEATSADLFQTLSRIFDGPLAT